MKGKGEIVRSQLRWLPARKTRTLQKKPAPRTESNGKEIEVISPEKELEEFHLCVLSIIYPAAFGPTGHGSSGIVFIHNRCPVPDRHRHPSGAPLFHSS